MVRWTSASRTLATLLDVTPETVGRWEKGDEEISRQTQLAVLLLVEHTARNGAPVPLAGRDEDEPGVRIIKVPSV